MRELDYKQKLVDYYYQSEQLSEFGLTEKEIKQIDEVLTRIAKNKGVYTVLITLALYKIFNPKQDIRQHKIELRNGFSGRSFDTKYITPTLKELGLPAMAESGWLTRSLEQAYAYDFDYKGKITPKELHSAFLETVASIQKSAINAEKILKALLAGGIRYQRENIVEIKKIKHSDLQIQTIIEILRTHFEEKYGTHGGSKLPVIAFYAIYSVLIDELGRFKDSRLSELGSHTASDRTSQSGGDIEIFKDDQLFEALEIKLDKAPTAHMVRVAYEKINKFGISRYYILSGLPPVENEITEINSLIEQIQNEHGCQVIVNGLYASLKYYLRLISDVKLFLNKYIELVEVDKELQKIHKEKLKLLLES
ncbi:restriction endonuclease, SacI family [Actinobacillus equuli subsp. equuli]|uniref:Restriction endonuclease, SacI family n=1 Tax=Actinobacillus equuli subsp. equuli TaxID=202947 RepID=A0A9X4G4P7_ACTEU|nr:restriction endonuclease, SacI family [Actinobacillus equuli]MDE8035286.1 restriction endonuclease, SacI family [Actinobacillus equuli subsp. equuli]MDG4948363.1 restriction endonuclease, SacI family [Actinobacillus equuli subsp. haemolyticus]